MRTDNAILEKSKKFAIRIVKLHKFLCEQKKEYILSKQLLRSGTGIGSNVREAVHGQSKKDFISKMCISLKEGSETEYWLELLNETGYLTKKQFDDIYSDCGELMRLLQAIIKTSKTRS